MPDSDADILPGSEQVTLSDTQALERALAQKTALLHEVDHRVKNNLQLICAMLLLQSRHEADPAVQRALRSVFERVNAVAIVHRRLFQSEDVERFDLATFAGDLVSDALAASGRDDIRTRLDLQRAEIAVAKAAPLALLVGEVLGNSLRHAFPDGRPGVLSVTVSRENGHARIEIADDGVGLANDGQRPGFGHTMTRLLCEQLHAECETTDAQPGVRTVIRLPVNGTH